MLRPSKAREAAPVAVSITVPAASPVEASAATPAERSREAIDAAGRSLLALLIRRKIRGHAPGMQGVAPDHADGRARTPAGPPEAMLRR